MKAVYPVLFTKTDDGKYLIEAPDLNVLTEGKDMSDAIKMARDAMELTCVSMEDREVEIPKPTNITDIDIAKSTFLMKEKLLFHWLILIQQNIEEKLIQNL